MEEASGLSASEETAHERETRTESAPSKFWQELGDSHAEMLGAHGLGEIKRQQALRYFTWQWRWAQVRRSEQMRFLLANTSPLAKVAAAAAPQPLGDALWRGLPWKRSDRWLYTFATRLIWDYALRHGDSEVLALGEPSLGNPPPVIRGGQLISQDLANSALEVAAIRNGLGSTIPRSIVEIGAGYGRTAYALLGIFPAASYTIVDIEPALSVSRWYLASLYPDRDIRFLNADDVTPERIGEVDLAVSISSLQEMTHEQVAAYLRLLEDTVQSHVFLKQWRRWTNPVDQVVLDFEQYPIPPSWHRISYETSPVQTAFVQALWSTRSTGRLP
jgi:putative sugar O-methyltransferase